MRINCIYFLNLKLKMIILIVLDGKGKIFVWFLGCWGDMWELFLIVGFYNCFDVFVFLL